MTCTQVATLTQLSERSVDRAISTGRLEAAKTNGSLQIHRGAVRAWLVPSPGHLHGGGRGAEERVQIRYGEILGLERDSKMRIGPCRAITIFSSNEGQLLIASVCGVGILTEIFAALHRTLSF